MPEVHLVIKEDSSPIHSRSPPSGPYHAVFVYCSLYWSSTVSSSVSFRDSNASLFITESDHAVLYIMVVVEILNSAE